MNAVLADDEPQALDNLLHQLNNIHGIDVIGTYKDLDFETDVSLLSEADVMFLDVAMAEESGLEFASRVVENYPNLSIVFVTAYDNYAVDAFHMNALDYLVKPVQPERLQRTIERFRKVKGLTKNTQSTNTDTLRINVCNTLMFRMSEADEQPLKWRTAKAEELFLYLLDNRKKTVQKAELVTWLWPDLPTKKAYSQLYTAIYHIRKTLEPFKIHIGIASRQGGYCLWTRNVSIDMELWERYMDSAPPVSNESLPHYEKYMRLYTGPYLGDTPYAWLEGERYRLEERWIQIAKQMADVYEASSQYDNAVEWYVRIVSVRPEDEDVQFALMNIYARLGYGMLVDAQYKQLEKILDELDLEMSEAISKWYYSWWEHTKMKVFA